MGHYTRLRVYQLGTKGSSFSISVENHFTLVEARYNEHNSNDIWWELNNMGKTSIDVLHITSWDSDHCAYNELVGILEDLKPSKIEYPSCKPDTETGKNALREIQRYQGVKVPVTPAVVKAETKERLKGVDVFFNPIQDEGNHNDNSVVKLFRRGSFQILSLGDCESEEISKRLGSEELLQKEVDVIILAHHGSSTNFTTNEFLDAIKPRVAICCSNYGNDYGHPLPTIVKRLESAGIPLYHTKMGDIIIQTYNTHSFKVANYGKNNKELQDLVYYNNKTYYPNDVY